MFKLAWDRYKLLGHVLEDFVGRTAAMLFYFTVMIPFGLGARLFADLLQIKQPVHWVDREPITNTLEEARRQG